MSRPRPVLPGVIAMSTRRTTLRHFLLRPDADGTSQNIFLYCLAYAARKFGIQVHAIVVMSTHYHAILSDPRGLFPDFKREFHRLLANATKCHRGWPAEVFDKQPTSIVELVSAAAIAEKIAYAIVNPVACGAVPAEPPRSPALLHASAKSPSRRLPKGGPVPIRPPSRGGPIMMSSWHARRPLTPQLTPP